MGQIDNLKDIPFKDLRAYAEIVGFKGRASREAILRFIVEKSILDNAVEYLCMVETPPAPEPEPEPQTESEDDGEIQKMIDSIEDEYNNQSSRESLNVDIYVNIKAILNGKTGYSDAEYQKLCEDITLYLNKYFALILGKPIEFRFTDINGRTLLFDATSCEQKLNFDFWIYVNGKKRTLNLFKIWKSHHLRRECDEYEFKPYGEGEVDSTTSKQFNTFTGFKITKAESDEYVSTIDESEYTNQLNRWKYHFLEILANGDQEICMYMWQWFAQILQTPNRKTNSAMLMFSKQGGGKTCILDFIGRRIIGDKYYIKLSNQRDIKDFNCQMMDRLLIFLDEMKITNGETSNILKDAITSETSNYNEKFKAVKNSANYSNFVCASNNKQITRIENSDRRYFMTELNNKFGGRANDEKRKYFTELLSVSPYVIAHYLYHLDLSQFNSRIFTIKVDVEVSQKSRCMTTTEQWLDCVLRDESVIIQDEQSKDSVYSHYEDETRKTFKPKVRNVFWSEMKKIIPYTETRHGEGRQRYVQFPKLETLKTAFADHMNVPKWFEEDIDELLDKEIIQKS